MAFGDSQRKREFFNFLAQQGLVDAPPAPMPPAPMPMDIARGHNLPTNDPGIIAQMYGDTRVPQKAPSTSSQTALDLLINAPFQTYAPTGTVGNEQMNMQSRLINDRDLVNQMNVVIDRDLKRQVSGNEPLVSVDTVKNLAETTAETAASVPSLREALQSPSDTAAPVVDVAKEGFNTVNEIYAMPLDTRKAASGEQLYKNATGVETGVLSGDESIVNWQRLWALNPDTFGLPTGFDPAGRGTTEEDKAIIREIYTTAEAQGADGGRAVWEWYIGGFPALTRFLTDTVGDPVNWTMAATPVGELAIAKAAATTGTEATILRTVGQLLKAPEQIGDAPFTVPAGLFKAARWGAKGLRGADEVVETTGREGGNILTRSSEAQKARDAEEALIRQGVVANELQANPQYVNRAEQMAAEQSAARQALIEAEAINRVGGQGYAPRPDGQGRLIPGDQGPGPVGPLTNAVQQPGTPMPVNPNIGPAPLETQPLTPAPDLEIDNIMADVNRLQSPGTRVGPAPIVDQPSATPASFGVDYTGSYKTYDQPDGTRIKVYDTDDVIDTSVGVPKPVEDVPVVRSTPDSNLPTLNRVVDEETGQEVQFFFDPKPDGIDSVSTLAREQPHVYPAVEGDMKVWVEDKYQPSRNILRTDEALTPEQQLLKNDIPGAEPYMPKPGRGTTKEYTDYQGTNKALSRVYDAEAYGRLRVSTHLNGGDVSKLNYPLPSYLTNNAVSDPKLAKMLGVPVDKTKKGLSKEAAAARYMIETDPTIEQGLLKWLTDNKVFRTEPGVTDAEQRAYTRYMQAQTSKPWATGDTEQLDKIIADQGLIKAEVQVNPADVEKMPTTQTVRQRGDTWTADRLDTVLNLPPSAQAPIMQQVAPWAEDAYRNIATASPRTQVFTDLELAARLRVAAAENGITLKSPESIPFDENNLDEIIRAAVQEPDDYQADRIISELRDVGQIRYEPPVEYLRSLDPETYAVQQQAFDNYSRIVNLRGKLHASAADIQADTALRTAPLQNFPRQPLEGPSAPNKIAIPQKQYDDRVAREIKKITKEWANDPSKGVPTQGDNLLAVGLEDGRLTEAEITEFRAPQWIYYKKGGDVKRYQTTRFDILIEQMGMEKNVTLKDAVRETENIIRESHKNSPEGIRKVTKSGIVFAKYDTVTKIYRDMYLYNPVALVRNTFVDSFANSITQMMTGHKLSGLKSLPFLSPRVHWAMYRHNITKSDIVHPALSAAKNWDVNPGAGVVDVVTRELEDVGETAWAPVPIVGTALKHGQGLRHTTDQVNRANLWGDQFGREIKNALYGVEQTPAQYMAGITPDTGFYNRVIGVMGGGPKADEAVANLKMIEAKGGFNALDVKRQTGSAQLMKDWREASRRAGKNADEEVRRIFFSYRQTNADAATRRVFMFHYWMSRALVQHTKLALSNPLLLYRYTAAWEALSREADRQGLDGPMAPLQMYFEFMKGDGGMFGISNPVAAFTPYSMFADVFTSYGSETTWDKTLGKFGFLLPQIQGLGVAFGLTNRYPDALGTSSVRAMVRNVLDWDRNSGYNIFRLDPGVTGDPVQHYFNKVMERANALVREFAPEIEDVELPNLNAPKQNVVANLIVENAEAEWGVTYMDMTPDQKRVVDEAIWSVRNGASDNDRANEALAQMSDANMIAGTLNMVTPGGMRARSEYATDNSRAIDEAIDTGVSTPASDNAFAVSRAINSGSPEASELNIANDELKAVGTEREQQLYQGYSEIAFSKNLDPMGYVEIAGKVYRGYEMNAMSPENRAKLAEAWLLDNGSSPAWLDGYKAKRDATIASNEELPEYKAYQSMAGDYEGGETYTYKRTLDPVYQGGGIRAWREDLAGGDPAMTNPNFARAIEEERQKLQDRGVTGEKLEQQLDMWAIGPQGYNAYRGSKAKLNSPDPIDLSLPTTQIPPTPAQPAATEGGTGSTGTTTSGTTTDKPKKMPKWQVDLVNDLTAYDAAVKEFEAQYGSVGNYRFNPQVLEKYLPEMSDNMKQYYAWSEEQPPGSDTSIEGYLAMRDAEYEAKKVTDKDAADQAAATLGDVPTENVTVEQLLAGIPATEVRTYKGRATLPTPREKGVNTPFPTYRP